jgi:hypothetical protein
MQNATDIEKARAAMIAKRFGGNANGAKSADGIRRNQSAPKAQQDKKVLKLPENPIPRAVAQDLYLRSMTFSMSPSGAIVRSAPKIKLYKNEKLAHEDDGECYSEYEANLKPVILRGTYEQFLAVYSPGYVDDDWYFLLACESNQLRMAQYIYNNAPKVDVDGFANDVNPLSMASMNNNIDVVRWLLTLNNVNVRGKTVEDYSLLTNAIIEDFPSDIIMKMVDLGARLHEFDCYTWDEHPLYNALKRNRLDIAMYLLMHDFDPFFVCKEYPRTLFERTMSPEAKSLLLNYRTIMMKYCLDETSSAISPEEFAMIAELAELEQPEDSAAAEMEEDDE